MDKPTNWNDILEHCLERVARGEQVADCLRDFPVQADRLRPALEAAVTLHTRQRKPTASADARIKAAMLAQLREQKNSPVSSSRLSRYLGRLTPKRTLTTRRSNEMNQPFFVKFAGAIGAFALIAIVAAFALGLNNQTAPEASAVTATAESDTPLQAARTIIFNDETYTQEAFERDIVPKYERIIYFDARWLGDEDSNTFYAFTNTDDMEAFAAANGVDLGSTSDEAVQTEETTRLPVPTLTAEEVLDANGPIEFAWSYSTDELLSPDGELSVFATTQLLEGSDEVELNIDVRNASGSGYSESAMFDLRDAFVAEPLIVGWSPDSRHVYFTGKVVVDGCENLVGYWGLHRLSVADDISASTITTVRSPERDNGVFSALAMSPDGASIGLLPVTEAEEAGQVQMMDVVSAEIITTHPVDARFGEGTPSHQMHWSDDSTVLITQLHTSWCPSLGGETAFQLGDNIVFSSNDITPDEQAIALNIAQLTGDTLVVADAASGCEYSVNLETGAVDSATCRETLNDVDPVIDTVENGVSETPQPAPSPLTSPDGNWDVELEVGDGFDFIDVKLSVINDQADIVHTPVEETREAGFGGPADVIPVGWSPDSAYFYFANKLAPDGCDADIAIYSGLQRLNVSNGAVEMIFAQEMASVAIAPNLETIAYMPRPFPSNESINAIAFDTITLARSAYSLNPRYIDGATANELHFSADSQQLVAELHTSFCPSLSEQIDFWQLDIDGENDLTGATVGPAFSTSQVERIENQRVVVTFVEFVDGVLSVEETATGCLFETDALTGTITSPTCADRLK